MCWGEVGVGAGGIGALFCYFVYLVWLAAMDFDTRNVKLIFELLDDGHGLLGGITAQGQGLCARRQYFPEGPWHYCMQFLWQSHRQYTTGYILRKIMSD